MRVIRTGPALVGTDTVTAAAVAGGAAGRGRAAPVPHRPRRGLAEQRGDPRVRAFPGGGPAGRLAGWDGRAGRGAAAGWAGTVVNVPSGPRLPARRRGTRSPSSADPR